MNDRPLNEDAAFHTVHVKSLHVELLAGGTKLKEWFAEECPDHPGVEPIRGLGENGRVLAYCGGRDHAGTGASCGRQLTVYTVESQAMRQL